MFAQSSEQRRSPSRERVRVVLRRVDSENINSLVKKTKRIYESKPWLASLSKLVISTICIIHRQHNVCIVFISIKSRPSEKTFLIFKESLLKIHKYEVRLSPRQLRFEKDLVLCISLYIRVIRTITRQNYVEFEIIYEYVKKKKKRTRRNVIENRNRVLKQNT